MFGKKEGREEGKRPTLPKERRGERNGSIIS